MATDTLAPPARRPGLIWAAVVVACLSAFAWLVPVAVVPRSVPIAFALAAILAFMTLPVFDMQLGAKVALSLALAALAAATMWLALATSTVVMSIALYFVLWWTLLFAVLPFGVRSQHDAQDVSPGSDPGAPVAPLLRRKVFITSVVSALVLVGVQLFLLYRPIPNVLPFA